MKPETIEKLEKRRNSILIFDIETCASYPNGDKINISTHFEDYVQYAKCKWFGCYSYKYDKYVCDEVKGNEDRIKNFIAEHNILIGFNNEEFDTPILYNNDLMPDKKFFQVDCLTVLGASTAYRHSGLSFKNRGALMGYKFKTNSLKNIAIAMDLETQKGDIDYNIFFQDSYTEEERKDILKYLKADVKVTKLMFDKLWEFWYPFTKFLNNKNIMNLSWIRASIASLTYKAACHTLDVEETYSDDHDSKKELMGGRVIVPKYEEAHGVWYVDFASLYPHIYAMFNLFNEETPNKFGEIENKENLWHGNDLFKVKGYYDISKQHILSADVAIKLKERMRLKKENPDDPMAYALKIFLNSLYGANRSPIFEQIHTPNSGWDCCWLGQQINHLTEKMMDEFGFETIAGDTDSIFVIARDEKNNNRDYVNFCLQRVIGKIIANVPFPCDTFKIDIENYLEYAMWPFELAPVVGPDGKNMKNDKNRLIKELKGKKKNYVYLYKKGDELKVEMKGLPIIKDNATKLGPIILEETIKPIILETCSAKFYKQEIDNMLKSYLEKPGALKLLSREFRVKPLKTYKNDSVIQAQISKGYFNEQGGSIYLIKNKKYGKAGKTSKYCTEEEAIEQGLTIKDLDLTKIENELSPFVRNE